MRLNTSFDNLLNVSNYIGTIQELNTTELMMNYHDICTVFAVTNTSGATQSLQNADRQLKQESDRDLCYYNT